MSPRRTPQSFAVRRIASGALALACALPVSGQSKTATEAGEQGRGSGRNQTQSQSRPGPAPAPSPTPAPAARPPGAAPSSPRFGGPVPRDARVELPSDARPSVPPDARQPLGQQGLSQKPPRMERWSQGRPSAGSKRVPLPDKAGEEESALERARRIDQDARERHGLDDGDGSSRPDGSHRPRRVYPGGYYSNWGYGPYWNHGYDRPYGEWSGDDWSGNDRGFNQDWERDDWDDWGEPAGEVADVGVGVAGGAGGRADWGAGWDERDLPLLPPDDLLLE